MNRETYERLVVHTERGVAFVTIGSPPINILDAALIDELHDVASRLDADEDVRAVVFQSATPDFFTAHLDVNVVNQDFSGFLYEFTDLWRFQQMIRRVAAMTKATIGKVEGRARGGGSEFLLALDMCFGALETAIFGQPEIGFKLLPGGGRDAASDLADRSRPGLGDVVER